MKHFLALRDIKPREIIKLIDLSIEVKKNPGKYSKSLDRKSLLMLFDKVSVRTRLSFEIGMYQLGGFAPFYRIDESTLGKKESIEDFSRVVCRYVNGIMARISSQDDLEKIAANSRVPVINGMTNFEHPCQVIADLMTIREHKGKLRGLKLAYLGDGFNNVTHSLLYGCSKVGINIAVASPKKFMPDRNVSIDAIKAAKDSGSKIEITDDPKAALSDADIVYTDSWMSYHIPPELEAERSKIFAPYQINKKAMSLTNIDAIFMHCLPAKRGAEVTDDVIDSKNSVVYDEAENRMHAQKAILLSLIK